MLGRMFGWFSTPQDEKQIMIDSLKKMSLEEKMTAAKSNEKYAFCLIENFEAELGGYNEALFKAKELDPYYAKNSQSMGPTDSGNYYFELAITHQNIKEAILASEKLRGKLAPTLLQDLQKTSIEFIMNGNK